VKLFFVIGAVVAAVVLGACGDVSTETTQAASSGTTTTALLATTTVASVTTTTVPPTTEPVGEPYDLWVPVPGEGPILGVVGVRFDDTLNVRSGPGTGFDVVATLGPVQAGIAGTGDGWLPPSGSAWWKVEADGVVGWANQRFLSRLGGVEDRTAQVVAELGEIPVAETMLDLGLMVAITFADVDFGSDVVVSVAPTVGDLGEVTYDVTGLGDDSLGGYRLHVFGQPTESGEGFSLMAVEATILCQRGVSGDLCL